MGMRGTAFAVSSYVRSVSDSWDHTLLVDLWDEGRVVGICDAAAR